MGPTLLHVEVYGLNSGLITKQGDLPYTWLNQTYMGPSLVFYSYAASTIVIGHITSNLTTRSMKYGLTRPPYH